jgi:hypothetical protein
MESIGQKINGKPVFPPAVAELRRRTWEKIPEGKYFKTSLVVPRENKSYAQVKTVWGMIIGMTIIELETLGEDTSSIYNLEKPTGNPIEAEPLKLYLYENCPISNANGRKVTLSKMDTEQASRFFETARNFIASKWGIVIPDPNPNYKENNNE